jgi:hypothetical protein
MGRATWWKLHYWYSVIEKIKVNTCNVIEKMKVNACISKSYSMLPTEKLHR